MQYNILNADPDFYVKRTKSLLTSDYPVDIINYNFIESDPLIVRWHWHEDVEFQYIIEGQFYITCGETNLNASKGDIIFINQNVHHFMTPACQDNCKICSIIVNPQFIIGLGQLELQKKYVSPVILSQKLNVLHIKTDSEYYETWNEYVQQLISLNAERIPGYELLTKAALLNLWKQLYDVASNSNNLCQKTASQDEQRTKQAVLYIQEHFMEAVTLDDIANSIMVSKSECCRCFKRTLGITPFEYLMKYRIQESAKRIQRRPQDSISEIAGSVGFNNTSYFNKIFKKYMECTPSEYRNSTHTIKRLT